MICLCEFRAMNRMANFIRFFVVVVACPVDRFWEDFDISVVDIFHY